MAVSVLFALLQEEGMGNKRMQFLYQQSRLYLISYARGHFVTSSLYCRRIAEFYVRYAHADDHPAQNDSLCEAVWALPHWYEKTNDRIGKNEDLSHIAVSLGMGLSSSSIFDDLTKLRWYGNGGIHVTDQQLDGYYADPDVFAATIRIIIATIALLREVSPAKL